jgi:hypothetical protein
MNALIAVLDPDVVRRADRNALPPEGGTEVHGAYNVAKETVTNAGLAEHARIALVNGAVGFVVVLRRQLRVALTFTVENDKVTQIDVIADPARIRVTSLAVLQEGLT